jgi:predicted ester cyclase
MELPMACEDHSPGAPPPPAAFLRGLAREPAFWAAAAGSLGVAAGLAGTFAQATLFGSNVPLGAAVGLRAWVVGPAGELLAALSLALGVPPLLDGLPRRAVRGAAAFAALLLLLPVVSLISASARPGAWAMDRWTSRWWGFGETIPTGDGPTLLVASFLAHLCLPPLAALPLAFAALAGRRTRLGALLVGLCALGIPVILAWFFFPDAMPAPSASPVLLGALGGGVGLLEAPLWAVLIFLLLDSARERFLGRRASAQTAENLRRVRRLYEEGLGRGDLSVLEGLVSEEFRDLRGGARGEKGMQRVLAGLRESFPDLAVCVDGQEASGSTITTRLSLSGTDLGGVLWYPATGRRATFSARFEDRFLGGELVEHGGETDTEGLLRQLGLPTADAALD